MRNFCLSLVFVFLFQTLSSAALWATKFDGVKLYKKPSTLSYEKFDYLKNFPLKIIGSSGNWYKVVDWMRMQGWVKKAQLKKELYCIVNRSKMNLRSGPSTRYSRVGRLYQGNVLRVLKTTKYWAKVKLVDPNTGQIGWAHRRYLWGI